jgi:hypothetical protein
MTREQQAVSQFLAESNLTYEEMVNIIWENRHYRRIFNLEFPPTKAALTKARMLDQYVKRRPDTGSGR